MEVYSPPRITAKAPKYNFTSGGALDLTEGWDFRKKDHQQAALRLIRDLQPVLVILSPPCTTFSSVRFLSNFKRDASVVAQEEAEGREHLRFSILIAKIQHRAGRGFLFEHPRAATSWSSPELEELRQLPGVFAVPEDAIIRHHRVPRRALFVPTGVAGCPQKPSSLSSHRITNMKFLKGTVQTMEDNWRTTAMPRQTMASEWTGSTTFPIQHQLLLPNDWKSVANYIVQAAAHPLHHYITEETAVQMEWTSAFPSHKTLGGAPSSSVVGGTSGPSTFNRFAGQEDDDMDVGMMDEEVDNPVKEEPDEETAETKVKHALRLLHFPKPATQHSSSRTQERAVQDPPQFRTSFIATLCKSSQTCRSEA
eukprot:s33_g71.t1